MTSTKDAAGEAEGFQGSVAGLGLADVIQLNGHNRFSGCITVQHGAAVGRIFFREGRIIHAEQDGRLGEEAFHDIMEWPAGRFSLEPNVSTTSHTIKLSCEHLLMDAHRVIDERRAGRGKQPPAPRDAPPGPGKATATTLVERVRGVPGVAYAVVTGKDAACLHDDTFQGEDLAGKTAYLALVGNQLGAIFRAGPLRSIAVHAAASPMLLLASKNHYLSVLVEAGAEVGPVESELRKLLGSSR